MSSEEFLSLLPQKSDDAEFEPRDEKELVLPPWNEADLQRLGLRYT